jgi:Ca2+-binding RTX toxin-like protein
MIAVVAPTVAFAVPPNDDFADSVSISGASGEVTGSSFTATKEAGEPDHAGNAGGHSVWYEWTAAADGNVAFTTQGSAFDTLLAVYTGNDVGSLTPVVASDDQGESTWSSVSFAVSSGETFRIAVDGFGGKSGVFVLSWHPAPANDHFADAELLPSVRVGRTTGTVQGATREAGEPSSSSFGGGTVWYSWTVPADGTYKFDTLGSSTDTVLAVYRGSALDSLDLVGVNDDDPLRGCCASWVPIRNASSGSTYAIAVSSLGEVSSENVIALRWTPLILGSPQAETLVGTPGNEEIRAREGDDVLRGLGGSDALFGGRGSDVTRGGTGNDFILDRAGADRLLGGDGNDVLEARDGRGNDVVSGGLGSDRCRTDAGDTRTRCP